MQIGRQFGRPVQFRLTRCHPCLLPSCLSVKTPGFPWCIFTYLRPMQEVAGGRAFLLSWTLLKSTILIFPFFWPWALIGGTVPAFLTLEWNTCTVMPSASQGPFLLSLSFLHFSVGGGPYTRGNVCGFPHCPACTQYWSQLGICIAVWDKKLN